MGTFILQRSRTQRGRCGQHVGLIFMDATQSFVLYVPWQRSYSLLSNYMGVNTYTE